MEENLPYFEYWDFLNGFTNLSTSNGLRLLEEYLQTKSQQRSRASFSECEKPRHCHTLKSLKEDPDHVKEDNKESESIKRRLLFDNDGPKAPVVIDMNKLSVEFDATCLINDDETEQLSPVKKDTELLNTAADTATTTDTSTGYNLSTDFNTPEMKEIPPVFIYG